jgi:hypothetical protein
MSRRSRAVFAAALLAAVAPTALAPRILSAEEPAGGVAFEPKDTPFADVLAKAKAGSKLVFVDFFTEW